MRLPTISQMVDENTISYYSFDDNATDACGKYNLYNAEDNKYNKNYAVYTTVGTYPGGGEAKSVHLNYDGGFYNSNLMNYINSNTVTIDLVFMMNYIPSTDQYTDSSILTLNYGSAFGDMSIDIKYKYDGKYIQKYNSGNGMYLTSIKKVPVNKWHHLVLIRDLNSDYRYTCYINGQFIENWNSNESYEYGFSIGNYDSRFPPVYDILYARISKGVRYTEEFIGQTPIDDLFYTLKEKNNEVYGKLKG